jgi:hypothetical protein
VFRHADRVVPAIKLAYAPGQLTLHNLQLKKGALDKFRFPVDVVEGVLIL